MAYCDYKLCDVCGGKAFYDANLDYYDVVSSDAGSREAGKPSYFKLGYVGDWAVLCDDCAKTHKTAIVPIAD